MNNTAIRKVGVLQGVAKAIADEHGLEPNDLVVLTVSLEKVIGAPVSYLLKQIEGDEVEVSTEVVQPFEEDYLMFLESRCRAIACTDIDENRRRAYLGIADAATVALSMQRRYGK